MEKGVSSTVSYVMVILLVITGAVAVYFWATGQRTPQLPEEDLPIDAYSISDTEIKVINKGTENSSSLTEMKTSVGDCDFVAATVLQPGIEELCSLSDPVSSGTSITVYANGIKPVLVEF